MNVTHSDKDLIILSSTNVGKEWIFSLGLFCMGFIPVFVYFSLLSIAFCLMVAVIVYLNCPQKEIISFHKTAKTITKETQGIRKTLTTKLVHDLDEFHRFSVEQSQKKNGAYRLILEFAKGMTIPMTESYYFSEKAVAQRAVACKVTAFLKSSQ